jgi:hypothetical protein
MVMSAQGLGKVQLPPATPLTLVLLLIGEDETDNLFESLVACPLSSTCAPIRTVVPLDLASVLHLWGHLSHPSQHHPGNIREGSCLHTPSPGLREATMIQYCGGHAEMTILWSTGLLHVESPVCFVDLRHEARTWLRCLYFGKMACIKWSD